MSLYLWGADEMTRVGQDDSFGSDSVPELYGAKNETVACQIIVSANGASLTGVAISYGNLTGEKGSIDSGNISVFKEHYVGIEAQSEYSPYAQQTYPDALIPLSGTFNVASDKNQPLWIDIAIPSNTINGYYSTTLNFTADGGKTNSMLVELNVWRFTLPNSPYMQSYFRVTEDQIDTYYGGTAAKRHVLYKLFSEMLIAHRVMPAYLNDTFPDVDGNGNANFDNDPYAGMTLNAADSLEYYFNELHINSLAVPIRGVDFPNKLGDDRAKLKVYLADYWAYFEARGWQDKIYVFQIDEPSTSTWQDVRDWHTLLTEVNNENNANFKFFVPLLPFSMRWEDISDSVDIWGIRGPTVWLDIDYGPGDRIIPTNTDVWWAQGRPISAWHDLVGNPDPLTESYSPIWLIDFPPLDYRIATWINQHYQSIGYDFKGLETWSINYWAGTDDIWDTVPPYNEGKQNGHGMITYPGTVAVTGSDAPIASKRLKWFRSSSYDYDYIQLLKEKGEESYAMGQVHSIVTNNTHWDNDPDKLLLARHNMGTALNELDLEEENTMTVITDLQTIETDLRQYALDLTAQADAIAQVIVDLQVLDDQLDQVSDIIDLD
jgi:hypothetical protein